MQKATTLSRFKPGSFRELLMLAMPLMVISFSDNIMIFFDRIILSHYSLTALNATTLASQAVEVFQYAIWAIAGMTEIFVARLYANKKYKVMAIPCWQMIYLALMSLPVVILISHLTGKLILHGIYQTLGLPYYMIMMYSVPLVGIVTALAGFHIGQGKMKLVLYSTMTINIINLVLDFILIFGIHNSIPAMGPAGAALSAVISLFIQAVWLFIIFLNKKNRDQFQTYLWDFNKKYFIKAIKAGLPLATSHISELFGWFVLIKIISGTNIKNFTIISVGSTLYLIFSFLSDGIYRALSTLISHHLGAENHQLLIRRSIILGLALLLTILLITAIPVVFFPNLILHLFNLKGHLLNWQHDLSIGLLFSWIFFMLNGVFWIYGAFFTAKNNTKFIMLVCTFSMWLFTILPVYLIVRFSSLAPELIWPLVDVYMFMSAAAIITRYLKTN